MNWRGGHKIGTMSLGFKMGYDNIAFNIFHLK